MMGLQWSPKIRIGSEKDYCKVKDLKKGYRRAHLYSEIVGKP